MNKDCEELEFIDEDAIRYILDFIPKEDQQGKNGITRAMVQFVLDAEYDYLESQGLIDNDTAEEALIEEDQVQEYVRTAAEKDNVKITDEQIQLILAGEFEYGVSIGIYEPEDE